MKNNQFIGEIIVILLLLGILFLLINPDDLLMPMSMSMMLTVGFIVVFFMFAGIVWKEKAHDERESLHRSEAGRISFLVGLLTLAAGVVVQSFSHNIDPWLVYTLILMIFSKLVWRIYSQIRH